MPIPGLGMSLPIIYLTIPGSVSFQVVDVNRFSIPSIENPGMCPDTVGSYLVANVFT